jgi:tetratricopeptide (TPR) repeat protein
MALGFGFNKAKVLSSAEKFVQQGKLQNAIAEYEKVIKEDPRDLTVLNAIGDLYARVGQNEKAAEYFKNVGDQYAHNGFTVKAIAVYKKLTRLSTSSDAIVKLAELYTQQGLFNDARAHYMQVADQLLKSGNNDQAAKIFQKILELDPENTTTQSKLADLYIKLGKKEEARNIYFSAAESLYSRSSFDAADEALSRVLSLDPENGKALLLRGMIASESGDTAAAIQHLDQVPDIDSHPDALRALLRAKLQAGAAEGAEGLAIKLLTVHHDASGISSLVEWLVGQQHVEQALKLYDQYADRLLSGGSASLEALYPLINRIRNSPDALERMLRLLQKAGDTSHVNEVTELLAHAHVQSGNFEQARDLYKQLSQLEPENPLHTQNYKQMLAKLGEDPMNRPLSEQESTQALMVEELEQTAPTIQQEYSPTVEKAIEAALTDAELFVSYNVPLKAIAPLEAVLPVAPRDLHVNQRLASLYLRAARFADAAQTCRLLSEIYAEFGHKEESARYAEEAQKYSKRAGVEGTRPAIPAAALPAEAPPVQPEPSASAAAASTVQEFVLDVPGEFFDTPVAETSAVIEETPAAQGTVSGFGFEVEQEAPPEPAKAPIAEPPKATPPEPTMAAVIPEEIEIDVSHEWEHMLSVEPDTTASPAPVPELVVEPAAPPEPVVPVPEAVPAGPDPVLIEDKIQEIRFYISQKFWDMAQTAIHDLAELTPENPQLAELRAAVAEGQAEAAAAAKAAAAPPAAPPPAAKAAPEPVPEVRPEPPQAKAPAVPEKPREEEKAEKKKEQEEFVLDLAEEPVPQAVEEADVLGIEPPPPPPPPSPAAAAKPPEPSADVLSEMVLDLEESLGDFVPIDEGSTSAPPQPAVSASASKSAPAPSVPKPPAHPVSVAASASSNGGMRDAESSSVLSDILSELQEDLGEDTVEAEDPETHYNLGIAFKEMGLLDEAIGELQKVCHALEHGNSFSQPVQAYTWLAQCLVDKGVPEAAVRWYEKALTLPGLDHTSRCAIYYDLGSAYEASGDKKAALANFMEVYSSNIDFRDVATRIKTLKS